MLYAMGKYVFLVGSAEWREAADGGKASPMPVRPRPSWVSESVRLAGHADVRWHLWIVLAAAGRLDVALVAYAAYFPARALLGAARKAVRHA
jgi:hypothetical protein